MAIFEWPCPKCGTPQRVRSFSAADAETVGSLCAACKEASEASSEKNGYEAHAQSRAQALATEARNKAPGPSSKKG